MYTIVTGAAGFVGSNLVDKLLKDKIKVIGIDNLIRGTTQNISQLQKNDNFIFLKNDINNMDSVYESIKKVIANEEISEWWHLAANSDIQAGNQSPEIDLKLTFLTTYNSIELCKRLNCKIFLFSSTSAIYGDLGEIPLHEEIGPLVPISNYGAMKLASEALVYSSSENWFDRVFVFRFPNVIGVPATHGVILDFINKLKKSPNCLDVLGNGTQSKGYLHVRELIDAMMYVRSHSKDKVAIFNIGTDDGGASVKFIAEECVKQFSQSASIAYGSENRGWVGDVPKFQYSILKLRNLGWSPTMSSEEAVKLSVRQIIDQLK